MRGDFSAETPVDDLKLKISKPKKSAAGINEMRFKKMESRYEKLKHYKEFYDKNQKDQ